jgi:hypothetical protein
MADEKQKRREVEIKMEEEDRDRRKQERERLRLEREERMLKAAREEEAFLRELEERKKQRDEQRRLREEEIRNSEEDHQRVLDEHRRLREVDRLQRRVGISAQYDKATSNRPMKAVAGSEARTLFGLFKSMKCEYQASVTYFCDMLTKMPDAGEITRFFENFKEELTKFRAVYARFPISNLEKYQSPSDRKILLSLIDAQDENGFTALHWAVFHGDVRATDTLLKNGASTEVRTYVNNHSPVNKIQPGFNQAAMHELFRKYNDTKKNRSPSNELNQATNAQNTEISRRDPSPFPFLELPIELQCIILEQLSIGTMFTVRCACKHLKGLQISNHHVAELPDMGKWQFVDPPHDGYHRDKRCKLTIMATPTVFHFGLIMSHYYKPPLTTGCDTVLKGLIARIEKFAAEDKKFKYDIDKLKEFLHHSNQRHKIYILEENLYYFKCSVYVELDPSFGVGIEFVSPGDPVPYQDDNDW